MTRLLLLLLLIPLQHFAQQPFPFINGTWLRTDMRIDGKSQSLSGQVHKRTFTDRSITHTMRDSVTKSTRQWHEMYRFIHDSCFIAVHGYEYSATWVSSNFRPEHIYCIKLLTDSQLTLTTSEGGTPIELQFRKIATEYVRDFELNINGNSNQQPVSKKREPLILQNTRDTGRFYTIDPWQQAEVSFEFRSEGEYIYLEFTGYIYRATDSTVYINFSSKRYTNDETNNSWEYTTSKDTVEEYLISNLVSVTNNTMRREMWKTTGGFFMAIGATAALVAAPLAGIGFRHDFEINERRYYNVAVPGLGAFFTGMTLAILARNKTYYLQLEDHDIDKHLWKPVK
ncbi:MAG: hypothetical protein IM638_08285 [Bacteroidetes bacterium]|nr:hypothetical protein [Bacteroidota bacterium]